MSYASIQEDGERMFRAIGSTEMDRGSALRDERGPSEAREELDSIIGAFIGERTRRGTSDSKREEVTIGPIYDIAQIVQDPHVIERELIADYQDPDMGAFPCITSCRASPLRRARDRAPETALGEHNRDPYRRSGVAKPRMRSLASEGDADITSRSIITRPSPRGATPKGERKNANPGFPVGARCLYVPRQRREMRGQGARAARIAICFDWREQVPTHEKDQRASKLCRPGAKRVLRRAGRTWWCGIKRAGLDDGRDREACSRPEVTAIRGGAKVEDGPTSTTAGTRRGAKNRSEGAASQTAIRLIDHGRNSGAFFRMTEIATRGRRT